MSIGAGGAAVAAAAHQARLREEEERLTRYTQGDLDGWEFKIVRSHGRIKGDRFLDLCAEEKKNGWELVEKFDDYRIRFKRRVECREQDSTAMIDPYRTQVGMSDAALVLTIVGVSLVVVWALIFLIMR